MPLLAAGTKTGAQSRSILGRGQTVYKPPVAYDTMAALAGELVASIVRRRYGTLRREVINAEWFKTTEQAQIVINNWLKQYNHIRPHQALNMQLPLPGTLFEKAPISGPVKGS